MSTLRSVLEEMAAVGDHELTTQELATGIDEPTECWRLFDALLATPLPLPPHQRAHQTSHRTTQRATTNLGVVPRPPRPVIA